MTADNINKQHRKKKEKKKNGNNCKTVTKHIEKYLTTQFQTQATNVGDTDLQNALSHALYLIEQEIWANVNVNVNIEFI